MDVPLAPLTVRDRVGVELELVPPQDDDVCGLALSIGYRDGDPHPQGLAMLLDRAQAAEVAAWLSAFASVDAPSARTDWSSMFDREVKTLPGFDPLVRDREGWNICGRRLEVDGRPCVCICERGHDQMKHE